MSEITEAVLSAAELRRAFDESFASMPVQPSEEHEDVLLVRVAGDPYAIRLRDVAGVVAKRIVVPIPASDSHLLGLAGIRGNIVPVFSLGPLLGYAQAQEASRWMVLCGTDEPIALAFSEFEGYLRLPASSFHTDESSYSNAGHSSEIARTDSGARPVINIHHIVATIGNRNDHDRSPQE